jgi:PAS domain S-box-containing protein
MLAAAVLKSRSVKYIRKYKQMKEKKYQSILTLLDERLHRFIDIIGDVPYVALPSEKPEIICFAGKVKELSGYDVNEILADRQHWANIIHPDDQERVFTAFGRCKDCGTSFEINYRIIHKDGSLRYVLDKGEPVFNNKGEITQVEGIISAIGRSGNAEGIQVSTISEEITLVT